LQILNDDRYLIIGCNAVEAVLGGTNGWVTGNDSALGITLSFAQRVLLRLIV
jgi:hypothetical protein